MGQLLLPQNLWKHRNLQCVVVKAWVGRLNFLWIGGDFCSSIEWRSGFVTFMCSFSKFCIARVDARFGVGIPCILLVNAACIISHGVMNCVVDSISGGGVFPWCPAGLQDPVPLFVGVGPFTIVTCFLSIFGGGICSNSCTCPSGSSTHINTFSSIGRSISSVLRHWRIPESCTGRCTE